MWRVVEIIMEIYYSLCQSVLYGMKMLHFLWRCCLDSPIITSFRTNQNTNFIIYLIQKGYNVNTPNKFRDTPLHRAVLLSSSIQVVHELIKSGANINAHDRHNQTPLCYAIQVHNTEAVGILLYYGANVNIVCERGMTPLAYVFNFVSVNIGRMLVDYYDGLSNQEHYPVTNLHFAWAYYNAIPTWHLNKDVDVSSVTHTLPDFSLHMHSNKYSLFEYILYCIDHNIISLRYSSFFLKYVNDPYATTSEWLKGMYLLLESSIAEQLVQSCNDWMSSEEIEGFTLFQQLANVFYRKEVKSKDRISILYTFLCLGAQANTYDLIEMYLIYGFNEEVEALIDVTTVTNCYGEPLPLENDHNILMPAFILALEQDLTAKAIYKCLINQIKDYSNATEIDFIENRFRSFLGFFFISSEMKNQFMSLSQTELLNPKLLEICHTMQRLPEVPTLLELSRNQTRICIKRACNIKKPYQFRNIVRNLNVPQKLKDVIRFKRPLYYELIR